MLDKHNLWSDYNMLKVELMIEDSNDPNTKILNNGQTNPNDKPKKVYTSVDQYQPTGKLVYNPDLFEKIEKKVL